ncbi:unnamed protein product [Schistosoma mattheei]|uniref:Dendritic cell-specific transmembrane protein-like domain-containing protein n=1 Tax=Schistosoma mattheei TaxID=31246 RepID=A0AA85BAQ7_9TREM|nr:unnamed protein product [Schistosoma mattheei]
MLHQHVCILSILSTSFVLIYALISLRLSLPEQSLPNLSEEEFVITESIQKIIRNKSHIEIYDCILCLIYWLNEYISTVIPHKFAFHRYWLYRKILNIFWDLVVKSFIWFSTFSSIYTMIILLDEIGSIDNLIMIHFKKIFEKIHSKDINSDQLIIYFNYFENIQRQYKCCGIYSIEDWLGVTQYQGLFTEVSNELLDPWERVSNSIPKSCCDLEETVSCSQYFLKSIALKAFHSTNDRVFHNSTTFIHTDGCLNKVAAEERQIMYTFIIKYGIIGICLHIIRLTMFCVVYNHAEIKNVNKLAEIKQHSFTSSIYFSPLKNTRYISNSHLSIACGSYWLFGQPAFKQLQFGKLKSQWLEKSICIGWMFYKKGKHYITFLHRINFQKKGAQLNEFRQFLRFSIPAFEMMIYADGNDKEEIEANMIYGGYIARLSRMICFLLFGIFIGEFFLATVIPVKNEANELTSGDKRIPDYIIQRDAEALANDVEWIARIFIRITITLTAMVSCRFRCLLLLIIPSLAQTIGLSYLGNELLYVSITGPIQNLEHNLRSASQSIICFIKLAYNITRDINNFLEKGKEVIESEGDLNYIETIKVRSDQLKEKINKYNQSIQNINTEIEKAKTMVKRAESFLGSSINETNVYARMSMEMAKQAKQEMIKKAEASKDSIITMLKDKNVNKKYSIETRMQTTCMVFYKTRAMICEQSSIKACSRLQTILIATTRYPLLIKNTCLRRIASGIACPTDQTLENAINQCSSSLAKIGYSSGFGSLFLQAQQDLYNIKQTFHFIIQHKLFQLNKSLIGFIKDLQLLIVLILTYLLRTICLIVFYKAHIYITNYLLDPDHDNIYIESPFEKIDHKRSKQLRETLLPLKTYELNNVIWYQKMYTTIELKRVIQSLIKVIGFGFCLSILFFIDFYITELVQLLDEISSTTIKIGNQINNNKNYTFQQINSISNQYKFILKGDGIFTELLQKTIKILQYASDINFIYHLDICSPNVEFTKFKSVIRFIILWFIMIILCLLSGYILRLRHKLLNNFYPNCSKYRFIYLYNKLLVNRRCQMTTVRNRIVYQSRHNQLQSEMIKCSSYSLLHNLFKKKNKIHCIICMEKYIINNNSLLYICPYDNTVICQYCLITLFNNHKLCITCLDRNYEKLQKINNNITILKQIIMNQ